MRVLPALLAFALLLTGVPARGSVQPAAVEPTTEFPILVLVSIDGWRADFLARFRPPALSRLAERGVQAEGLIPVFPSKTFPNHYTLVTGLYPERHGIVSNNMRDPALPGIFTLANVRVQQDTRWWGGVPLWATVERQGRIAATMFWPGSDREIAGERPTYWHAYDRRVSNTKRVEQVLTWLALPPAQRPSFITLYFDEVDTIGHFRVLDAPELREAVLNVDTAIGRLIAGIERLDLDPPVNLIVLSDHGMSPLAPERTIYIDDYVDLATVDVVDWTPVFGASARHGRDEDLYAALRGRHPKLQVYRREDLPAEYRLAGHPRLPAVIGIADDGWTITSRARASAAPNVREVGNHGYDPRHASMHGFFIAAGPSFRSGITVPPFQNVHVYPLLCRVLGVKPERHDGDPAVTASFLVEQ